MKSSISLPLAIVDEALQSFNTETIKTISDLIYQIPEGNLFVCAGFENMVLMNDSHFWLNKDEIFIRFDTRTQKFMLYTQFSQTITIFQTSYETLSFLLGRYSIEQKRSISLSRQVQISNSQSISQNRFLRRKQMNKKEMIKQELSFLLEGSIECMVDLKYSMIGYIGIITSSYML